MNEAARIAEIVHLYPESAALAERIAANLQHHHLSGPASFPEFAVPIPPRAPRTLWAFELRQAALAYSEVWVTNDAPPRRNPLARLRHAAHSLVVYYVNRLAARQTRFNAALLRTLTHLSPPPPAEEVQALRREVAALQERVARLERQQEPRR